MTHDLRPRCVVCSATLPQMPLPEALAKGIAIDIDGRIYYRCIGRHTEQEIHQIINAVPKFTRASKVGA